MRWTVALALGGAALLAGCLRAGSVACENGAVCPEGLVCTEHARSLCGGVEEVSACFGAGKQDFASCEVAGAAGACLDGRCEACTNDLAGCRFSGWVQMASPVAANLQAIWFARTGEGYAVGEAATLVHYDGRRWQVAGALPEPAGGAKFSAVWGDPDPLVLHVLTATGKVYSGRDTWAETSPPSSLPPTTLWGLSSEAVYAGGTSGEVWKFDGTGWSDRSLGTTAVTINGIWGTSESNLFAVGRASTTGVVWHFDGASWSQVAMGGSNLAAIWGSGPDDVFVVGKGSAATPTILHFDGTSWTTHEAIAASGIPNYELHTVWGSGGAVFAAGPAGVILHYDGAQWTFTRLEDQVELRGLGGAGPEDVTVVGDGGTIWRYSGVP